MEFHYFNIFDVFILVVIFFSAIVGFIRGFVREALGLGAWSAAAWVGIKEFPLITDFFGKWVQNVLLLKLISHLTVFALALILFLLITQLLSLWIQGSMVQSINRSLGIIFGLLRGSLFVIAGYMTTLYFVRLEEQPQIILSSKSISFLQKISLSAYPYLPEKASSALLLENIQKLKAQELDAQKLTDELSCPKPE